MPGRYDLVVSMASLQGTPDSYIEVKANNGVHLGIMEKSSEGYGPFPPWPAAESRLAPWPEGSQGGAVWKTFRLAVTVEGIVPKDVTTSFTSFVATQKVSPGISFQKDRLTLERVIVNDDRASVNTHYV